MKYVNERQALIDTALAMNASGLNQGAAGNLSVRVKQGFLITPSGLAYDQLVVADIVQMSLAGEVMETVDMASGMTDRATLTEKVRSNEEIHTARVPSSEWRFHRDIYAARSDAQAVLHAHSSWCTTLACLQREIPAFHYMVAAAGGDNIRCGPYATFGTQKLSDHALAALEDRRACLLAHHGMITLHESLPKVLALAGEVEQLARVYCQALQIGEPQPLDKKEMQRVIEKFKTYGQPR